MSAVGTGAVAGPALGGVIVSAFGWRWIFFATTITRSYFDYCGDAHPATRYKRKREIKVPV